MAKDKRKGGRVTPKASAQPDSRTRRPPRPTTGRRERIGPFERPDADKPLGQVGRRPSSPGRLFFFAAVYFGCGVASFFVLHKTVGVIIGIVLIGISGLWLRGALTAYARQNRT